MIIARDVDIGSIFFNPGSISSRHNANAINDLLFSMYDLGICISLAKHNYTQLNCRWIYSRELHPFFPENFPTIVNNVHVPQYSKEFCLKDLVFARMLLPNYVHLTSRSERFARAIDRWRNSIDEFSEQDKLIKLRIAMESLFTEGQGPSIRISINAAKFLKTDLGDKEKMFMCIREFYGIASRIMHGEKMEVSEDYVFKIQDICRESILKIIQEGEMPDWNQNLLV